MQNCKERTVRVVLPLNDILKYKSVNTQIYIAMAYTHMCGCKCHCVKPKPDVVASIIIRVSRKFTYKAGEHLLSYKVINATITELKRLLSTFAYKLGIHYYDLNEESASMRTDIFKNGFCSHFC